MGFFVKTNPQDSISDISKGNNLELSSVNPGAFAFAWSFVKELARTPNRVLTSVVVIVYEHHGPKGHLGFAPRISPDHFRAPFTAAEGWGTFSQTRQAQGQKETIAVKYGKLRLRTLAFEIAEGFSPSGATFAIKGKKLEAPIKVEGRRVMVTLPEETVIIAGESMDLELA